MCFMVVRTTKSPAPKEEKSNRLGYKRAESRNCRSRRKEAHFYKIARSEPDQSLLTSAPTILESSQFKWRSVLVAEQLIGRRVVGEPFGLRIPFQIGLGLVGDVCNQGSRGAAMADLDVAVAALAALDAVQEIAGVGGGGRAGAG